MEPECPMSQFGAIGPCALRYNDRREKIIGGRYKKGKTVMVWLQRDETFKTDILVNIGKHSCDCEDS